MNQRFSPLRNLIFQESLQQTGTIGFGESQTELMELGGGDWKLASRKLRERRFWNTGFKDEILLGDAPFLDTAL